MALWVGVVVLGIPAALLLWGVAIYNRLVKFTNMVEEGWSGIDVQLKRRANLIPNLIAAVKGYLSHEGDLLTRVTELRRESLKTGDRARKGGVEGALSGALGNIMAVAENYPELKADRSFLSLQKQLAEIEDELQLARRYYNGTVRNLNTLVDSFPSNIVASRFRFNSAEFFEIDDPAEKAVPKVAF
jgi:LemA protein